MTDPQTRILAFELMLELIPENFTCDFDYETENEIILPIRSNSHIKTHEQLFEESDFRIVVGQEPIQEKAKTPEPPTQNYLNFNYPIPRPLLTPPLHTESSITDSELLRTPDLEEDEEEEYERPPAFNPSFKAHLPQLEEEAGLELPLVEIKKQKDVEST